MSRFGEDRDRVGSRDVDMEVTGTCCARSSMAKVARGSAQIIRQSGIAVLPICRAVDEGSDRGLATLRLRLDATFRSWREISYSRSSRGVPRFRILFPPAVSLRTIGPSAKGASFGAAIPAFIPFEVPRSGYHSHVAFARPRRRGSCRAEAPVRSWRVGTARSG